jgi:hypothetical protein
MWLALNLPICVGETCPGTVPVTVSGAKASWFPATALSSSGTEPEAAETGVLLFQRDRHLVDINPERVVNPQLVTERAMTPVLTRF